MKQKRFNVILNERIRKTKSILAAKGEEYGSVDRLHNFKAAAAVDGETPLQAAWGMAKKHLISVKDMKDGLLPITEFMVDEKIGDLINYLILIEAIMIEGLDDKVMTATEILTEEVEERR